MPKQEGSNSCLGNASADATYKPGEKNVNGEGDSLLRSQMLPRSGVTYEPEGRISSGEENSILRSKSTYLSGTPINDGYHMPAEWEMHKRYAA